MIAAGTTSVIIPVFNGERFVAEAIESALAQTRPVEEIIVVDDGSTDATVEIVGSFPSVRLIRQENRGPAAARNRAIRVTTCDYIAPLDADDLWPPERHEIMAGLLDADDAIGCVLGDQQIEIDPDIPTPWWMVGSSADDAARHEEARATGVVVARRSVFEQIGLFDETLRHGEDTDWFLRNIDAGIVWRTVPETVLIRRIHGANLTLDASAHRKAMFDVLKRRAARKRASS